jgi:hypothetical protein
MSDDFVKAPVFGIDESELATGSVGDNEVSGIDGKKIKPHSVTSDQMASGSVGAVQIQAGALTAFKVTVPNRVKGTTVVFSIGGANNDTLQWTSGVAYLMKMKYTPDDTMGDIQVVTVQQTIQGGSYQFKSGDSAYYFYVEWEQEEDGDEPSDDATLTVEKSTTYPDNDTAIVLAYSWYDPNLGLAQYQALDTAGGGVKISGNSIIAGSIVSQNIKSGSITTDRLAFPAFNKNTDTLDSISDGVFYKKISSTQINTFTDGSTRAISYIGIDGKYQTAFQSNLHDRPPNTGLYITADHIGFYRKDLDAWTVDIMSSGAMLLGSPNNNQYLTWDGQTLTVKGNIVSSTITSSTITGSILETNAGGERIEISTSNFITFYDSSNFISATVSAPTGTGLTIISHGALSISSGGNMNIQSSSGNINLIPASGNYVTVQGPLYMSVNQPIYFGGINNGIYGSGGSLTVTVGMSINGALYVGNGISLGYGYGIRFYSPSGLGGNFWYANGNLYFKDENGNQRTISYT